MTHILFFITILLYGVSIANASSVIYTPGPSIAMTGSNTTVRFDVASALTVNGIPSYIPSLDTTTAIPNFTGAFYATGIGWIQFSSGTNQVSLDCGIQSLTNLTTICSLTGTGWSENTGDVDFSNVQYDPQTGLLQGTGGTYAGDIDLTGIALPLRPILLNETDAIANHIATLSVSGAWRYDGGALGWNGTIITGIDSQAITGLQGIYIADFSLASTYEIRIIDTNGSETKISPFRVNPGIPSSTIEPASFHAKIYCNGSGSGSTLCPDTTPTLTDNNVSATLIAQLPSIPVVANGTDTYTLTLKVRDTYGNRVENGTMRLKYRTTVKNIQTDPLGGIDNINYGPSFDGDAFLSPELGSGLFGSAGMNTTLNTADTVYTIASTAPTDAVNNVIQLESLKYNAGSDMALPAWKSTLIFSPMYAASVMSSGTPVVNTPHTFVTTVTKNDTTSTLIPTVITTLRVGTLAIDQWKSLTSMPAQICANYPSTMASDNLCDWGGVSSIATSSASDFVFTGTYTTLSAIPEATDIKNYIYYRIGVIDILYETNPATIANATITSERVRVLGQSGEGVKGGSIARVNLINNIREQVALLSRNRFIYTDTDYIIHGTNQIIKNANFNDKRTIIVVGADIIIDDNILNRAEHPLTLIALTDLSGKGGNIIIRGGVTDIHSSLIAEHGITSEVSDSQLYIHGSVVSANPPKQNPPTTCPYFTSSGCVQSDYDLPGARVGFSALADPTPKQSLGGSTYTTPLIIEADPRLVRDPGPAMSK